MPDDEDGDRLRVFRLGTSRSTERTAFSRRLEDAFTAYCSEVERALRIVREGRRQSDLDTDEQWLVQHEALARRKFLQAMNAPPEAAAIATTVLRAWEHRRIGLPDPLIAMPKKVLSQPEFQELKLRTRTVQAAIALRDSQRCRTLDDAYGELAERLSWISSDPVWCERLGAAPTIQAIRGWYERRNQDTRFGRFFTAFNEGLPHLSSDGLAGWLLDSIASADGEACQL